MLALLDCHSVRWHGECDTKDWCYNQVCFGANGPNASYVFIWGHPVKQRIKIEQFKSLATANKRHITTHSAASILKLQAEFE